MSETHVAVYPPELGPTVPCWRCHGEASHPPCTSCTGSGLMPRKHYAYCKRAECVGCLPTVEEIDQWVNILDVWAEQLARCIPQSPATKTHDGAVAAIRARADEYHSVAYFARRHSLLIERLRPMLDGCRHQFDPECARCELLTPVRLAVEEADRR